jgi:predicted dehydrogenase
MALRVEDCDAMIAACRRSGSRLFVVKQNRFNPAVVAARKALDEGRFGRMVTGAVCVRWRRDQSYYDQAAWRGTWALDGGVMSQQASHHLDLLQWFMGPVETVQCRIATRLMNIEAEDTAVAIMCFKSGALGSFEATVAARPEDLCGTLSLLGEHGAVIVGGVAVNRIEHWKFDDERPEDKDIASSASQEVPSVYGYGHMPYLAHVVKAIRDGTPGPVEADEGRKNIQILAALYESAACGGAPVAPGSPILHTPFGRRAR